MFAQACLRFVVTACWRSPQSSDCGAKVEFDCSTDKNKKNSTQSNRAKTFKYPVFIVVSRNKKKFDWPPSKEASRTLQSNFYRKTIDLHRYSEVSNAATNFSIQAASYFLSVRNSLNQSCCISLVRLFTMPKVFGFSFVVRYWVFDRQWSIY